MRGPVMNAVTAAVTGLGETGIFPRVKLIRVRVRVRFTVKVTSGTFPKVKPIGCP